MANERLYLLQAPRLRQWRRHRQQTFGCTSPLHDVNCIDSLDDNNMDIGAYGEAWLVEGGGGNGTTAMMTDGDGDATPWMYENGTEFAAFSGVYYEHRSVFICT